MGTSSQPNFTMLTKYLHNLFRLYIINGRTRAPPEWELSDMIPTFQLGAKTNRRALQSKFKSWAKRMELENDNLVLASSRKLIVPKDDCDELIMSLHSENHMAISTIIFQIQQKYTWTKKNFGMDQETVVRVISAHCKKDDCWRDIKSVLTSRNFPKERLPLTTIQSRFIQGWDMSQKNNRQPIPIFSSKQFTSELYSYPSSINNCISECNRLPMRGIFNWESYGEKYSLSNNEKLHTVVKGKNIVDNIQNNHLKKYPSSSMIPSISMDFFAKPGNISMSQASQRKNHFLQALGLSHKYEKFPFRHKKPVSTLTSKRVGIASFEGNASNRKRLSLMRSRKKIRNITEFKNLLKGAEEKPKLYPAVLRNQKTKFLSSLSLAPKRICSSKMLSQFGEELHKKHTMEKRDWFKKGHKVLRDRNKLIKKSSHYQKPERFSYLSTCHKSSMCNVMVPLGDGQKESKLNERENQISLMTKKVNFLRFPNNESRKGLDAVEHIDRLDGEVNTFQNHNLLKHNKENIIFASENQEYLRTKLATSKGSFVQEQPKWYCQEKYKNITLKSELLLPPNRKRFKNRQESMNLEDDNSTHSLSSPNDSFAKLNPLCSNFVRTPHPSYPFMGPLLIPVSSASNAAFLPPSSFPLIVRPLNPHPLTKMQIQPVNMTGQSVVNTPIVWGYLANGRVNVLNQDGNSKLKSHVPLKQFPRNSKVFIEKSEETASGSLQPYRLLAPKNKVRDGLEIKSNTSRKRDLYNIPQKKDLWEIRKNLVKNQLGGNSPALPTKKMETHDSSTKDVVEMKKLTNWIRRMMLTVIPSTYGKAIEESTLNLTAELNYGIGIVREIRNALSDT